MAVTMLVTFLFSSLFCLVFVCGGGSATLFHDLSCLVLGILRLLSPFRTWLGTSVALPPVLPFLLFLTRSNTSKFIFTRSNTSKLSSPPTYFSVSLLLAISRSPCATFTSCSPHSLLSDSNNL